MKWELSTTKGHILGGGGNPRQVSNIYMGEHCMICDKYLDDNIKVLRNASNKALILCEECCYAIHAAYEANL
jgi:hypothetical protein